LKHQALQSGDNYGLTPLHYAALCNSLEIVNLLLRYGADRSAVTLRSGYFEYYTGHPFVANMTALDIKYTEIKSKERDEIIAALERIVPEEYEKRLINFCMIHNISQIQYLLSLKRY